jgi:hypothetical protein
MSPWARSVVAGLSTAPSFIVARVISHSGTTLGSIISTRSPRLTPSRRRKLATRLERTRISSNVTFHSAPCSSTIQSAGRSLPRAMSSK